MKEIFDQRSNIEIEIYINIEERNNLLKQHVQNKEQEKTKILEKK